MKRKRLAVLLAAVCLVTTALSGCGKGKDATQTDSETTQEADTENAGDTQGAESAENAEINLQELTAQELGVLMGNGINLGNTLEAYGHKEGIDQEISFYETLWGQPVTTQEMIDDMKAGGYDTLRIPVAWTNTMDFENGDYTISEDYLARVKEVVDYAYQDQMYVVLNDHWDGGWYGMFGSADEAKRESAMELYISMWTQVAEYFKDYDYHLIFEGANEEVGDRLNDIDADFNPDGATLTKDECYAKALEINQTFVDTVRATGGNNADRFLLIPGYGTDITQTLDERWQMPTDTAKDKLFLSVHYYTPWSYCGSTGSTTWGTQKNYTEMNTLLEQISKFTEAGYGIIIGECGVLPTSNAEMKPNSLLWYANFFANCDLYGYVPLIWDTGTMIDRTTGNWMNEDLKQFMIDHSYVNESGLTADEIEANAKTTIEEGLAAAPETFQKEAILSGDGSAVAWIMWDSQDWNTVYSVGDTYDPDSKTEGIVATDVVVTGEGTYTVALDFTGTDVGYSTSTAFSAIGIANGEELFPGYIIDIQSILINGEEYQMQGRSYTASDDGLCTRSNLYNGWVATPPDDARAMGPTLDGCTASLFDQASLGDIKTLEITFKYVAGKEGKSENDGKEPGTAGATSWIMWDSQDWNIVYSVGDTFDPDSATAGITATNAEVTGEGTYTVALDFTGTDAGMSVSTAFAAIGIENGEDLFPGYIVDVQSVKINGEEYQMIARTFTTSDDGHCTRVNLYNGWVASLPEEARTSGGGLTGAAAIVLDQAELGEIRTIEVTYQYKPGENGISANDANSKN